MAEVACEATKYILPVVARAEYEASSITQGIVARAREICDGNKYVQKQLFTAARNVAAMSCILYFY